MTESKTENNKRIMIEIDPEFDKILQRLNNKINQVTWDGLDKISTKKLTKIIAKKINTSRLV